MFVDTFTTGLCYGTGEFIRGRAHTNTTWSSCGPPGPTYYDTVSAVVAWLAILAFAKCLAVWFADGGVRRGVLLCANFFYFVPHLDSRTSGENFSQAFVLLALAAVVFTDHADRIRLLVISGFLGDGEAEAEGPDAHGRVLDLLRLGLRHGDLGGVGGLRGQRLRLGDVGLPRDVLLRALVPEAGGDPGDLPGELGDEAEEAPDDPAVGGA